MEQSLKVAGLMMKSHQMFKDELFQVKVLSLFGLTPPGGDCIAASQIYTMLMEYPR